jgi:hypothetical protein
MKHFNLDAEPPVMSLLLGGEIMAMNTFIAHFPHDEEFCP